jgi:hypothetical protein
MTYDMHGAWDAPGPTNFQDPIYTAPNDHITPIAPGSGKYGVDLAMKAWTVGAPEYGIPWFYDGSTLYVGDSKTVHRGEGGLHPLQRIRRGDDVPAVRPRPGGNAVQRGGQRHHRQPRQLHTTDRHPTTPPSPTVAPSASASVSPTGGTCSAPAWNASTAYVGGTRVS